jgi:molybdopterin molybdotransferase
MIPVEEAQARVLEAAKPTGVELIMLADAHGRTLAEPITARRTQPPADMSAMDGYALRAADAVAAPANLMVIGESPAGRPFTGTVGEGQAVRIFTGGEVPTGADSIVLQEDVDRDGDTVRLNEAAELGRHIRRAGLDFRSGETTIPAGTVMTPGQLSLAAGMNIVWVRAARRPRVAILATGDEIKLPGDELAPGQIIGSSGLGIAAYVRDCGGEPLMLDVAKDDEGALMSAAQQAAGCDILVTLGGASVGDHDLVQSALAKEGLDVDFWRIAMRPGKPLMFGALGGQMVLGLPGNPVSTMVCAHLFLGPAIRHMLGREDTAPPATYARLKTPMSANDRRQDYVRARITAEQEHGFAVEPFRVQDSSMMSVYAAANALIVRPPHTEAAEIGDLVQVLPLDFI